MTTQQFDKQLGRLTRVFGDKNYPDERMRLIWREVSNMSDPWMERTVDKFIGEFSKAPLLPDFRHEMASAREQGWASEKKQHASESKAAMKSIFAPEEIAMICQTTCARIRGQMKDQDFEKFQQLLGSDRRLSKCRYCSNSGIVFADSGVFRCCCEYGRDDERAYPVFEPPIRAVG